MDLTQIQKLKRENSFKNSKKVLDQKKRTAPTAYSQVYPVIIYYLKQMFYFNQIFNHSNKKVTKKKKKLNHGTKMVALPFGSLSGVNLTK